MKFSADIHGSQMNYPNYLGDPFTLTTRLTLMVLTFMSQDDLQQYPIA